MSILANRRSVLSLFLLSLGGCDMAADLAPLGGGGVSSMGGMAMGRRSIVDGQQLGGFDLGYDNWITFNRSIIASVDSVFARMKDGDPNTRNSVFDLIKPGVKVIRDRTGIDLATYDVKPDAKDIKFRFSAPFTPWRMEVWASPPTRWLVRLLDPVPNVVAQLRWRGSADGDATFSSLTPRQVSLSGLIKVEVQGRNGDTGSWEDLSFQDDKVQAEADSLRRALNKAYYPVLARLGVNTTPRFRGSTEP